MSYRESVAKKLARAAAYLWARAWFRNRGRLGACRVLALCGEEAGDVPVVRAMGLTGKPGDLVLVDTDPAATAAAKARDPKVTTIRADLGTVDAGVFDLAVLDFCGHLESPNTRHGMEVLRDALKPGSVVITTYLRGRETSPLFGARAGEERDDVATHHMSLPPADRERMLREAHNTARIWIAGGLLSEASGIPPSDYMGLRGRDWCLHFESGILYHNGTSPMGMTIHSVRRHGKVRHLIEQRAGFPLPVYRNHRGMLVIASHLLEVAGFDAPSALNVAPRSLAAMRACFTMGRYPPPSDPRHLKEGRGALTFFREVAFGRTEFHGWRGERMAP